MSARRSLGIDLSADPKGTAACLIAWSDGGAEVEELVSGSRNGTPLDNKELLRMIRGATKTGVDAPFGWPLPFVGAVRDWQRSWEEGGRWPASDGFGEFRYRLTDSQITDPRPPLSVSSDLIGVTAMRCASLLAELGKRVDRAGLRGPLIEVYPAAALVRWGLPAEGYKKSRGTDVRSDLVDQLCERLESVCPLEAADRELCERDDTPSMP